jgi:hypothetical protein
VVAGICVSRQLENFSNLITAGAIHYEEIIAQLMGLK